MTDDERASDALSPWDKFLLACDELEPVLDRRIVNKRRPRRPPEETEPEPPSMRLLTAS